MKLTLTPIDGTPLEVTVPAGWPQVTVRTFLALQGKPEPAQHAMLCGLAMEQYAQLDEQATDMLAHLLHFAQTEPATEGLEYPTNIGAEPIGLMELSKKALADMAEAGPFAALPYLYAAYMKRERIDMELAFVQGFPLPLMQEIHALPITEVYTPAVFFLKQIAEKSEFYGPLVHREPEADHLAAGFDRLNQFGFFGAARALSKSEKRSRIDILNTPADIFYMDMYYDTVSDYCLKDLQEVQKNKKAA